MSLLLVPGQYQNAGVWWEVGDDEFSWIAGKGGGIWGMGEYLAKNSNYSFLGGPTEAEVNNKGTANLATRAISLQFSQHVQSHWTNFRLGHCAVARIISRGPTLAFQPLAWIQIFCDKSDLYKCDVRPTNMC